MVVPRRASKFSNTTYTFTGADSNRLENLLDDLIPAIEASQQRRTEQEAAAAWDARPQEAHRTHCVTVTYPVDPSQDAIVTIRVSRSKGVELINSLDMTPQ